MPGIALIQDQLLSVRSQIKGRTGNVHYQICDALNNLRDDLIAASSAEHAEYIARSIPKVETSKGNPPYPADPHAANLVCNLLLGVCKDQLGGESKVPAPVSPPGGDKATSRKVFIVHGHDEPNLLRLEKLLEKRWGLAPSILRDQASSGKTLIEKFEKHARGSGYAFILLTPDDQVVTKSGAIFQARPNVIIELGWFCGCLGRSNVCILYKSGTSIHSDLAGVVRVEFQQSVEEKLGEIETELKAAGLI